MGIKISKDIFKILFIHLFYYKIYTKTHESYIFNTKTHENLNSH